jgi:hypothetical protein
MSNEMTFDIQVLKGQIQGAVGCKFWLKLIAPHSLPFSLKISLFVPRPRSFYWGQSTQCVVSACDLFR